MNRRETIRILLALPLAGGAAALLGCKSNQKTASDSMPSAEPPLASPSESPTAAPSDESVAETSPSPEASPTESAPEEPAAPYGELADGQRERLTVVTQKLSGVNADEMARWSDNLAYDATGAERELRAWEKIADAYSNYASTHSDMSDNGKREAFSAILMRSLLPEAQALRCVKLSVLSPDDARAAMALLNGPVASPVATS